MTHIMDIEQSNEAAYSTFIECKDTSCIPCTCRLCTFKTTPHSVQTRDMATLYHTPTTHPHTHTCTHTNTHWFCKKALMMASGGKWHKLPWLPTLKYNPKVSLLLRMNLLTSPWEHGLSGLLLTQLLRILYTWQTREWGDANTTL